MDKLVFGDIRTSRRSRSIEEYLNRVKKNIVDKLPSFRTKKTFHVNKSRSFTDLTESDVELENNLYNFSRTELRSIESENLISFEDPNTVEKSFNMACGGFDGNPSVMNKDTQNISNMQQNIIDPQSTGAIPRRPIETETVSSTQNDNTNNNDLRQQIAQIQDRLKNLGLEIGEVVKASRDQISGLRYLNERSIQNDHAVQQQKQRTDAILQATEKFQSEVVSGLTSQNEFQRDFMQTVQQNIQTEMNLARERIQLDLQRNDDMFRQQISGTIANLESQIAQGVSRQNEQGVTQTPQFTQTVNDSQRLNQTRQNPFQQRPRFFTHFQNQNQSDDDDDYSVNTLDDIFTIKEIVKKIPDLKLTHEGVSSFISAVDLLYNAVNRNSRRDKMKFNMSIELKLVICSFAVRDSVKNKDWPQIKIILNNSYCILNTANDTQNKINTLSQKSKENLFEYGLRAKQLLIEMGNHLGINANPGMKSLVDKTVRKAFTRGLNNSRLENRVKSMPCRNLDELIDFTVEQSEGVNENSRDSEGTCNYCHGKNHREKECRKKKKDNDRRNQDHSGNNRNRDKNNYRGDNSRRGNDNNRGNDRNRDRDGNNRDGNRNDNSRRNDDRNHGNDRNRDRDRNENRNRNDRNNNHNYDRNNNRGSNSNNQNNSGYNSYPIEFSNQFGNNDQFVTQPTYTPLNQPQQTQSMHARMHFPTHFPTNMSN